MQIESSYIVLSGFFRFDYKKIDRGILNHYSNWKQRINKGDFEATFGYLNSAYYDNYIQNIFPEIRDEKIAEDLSEKFVNHLTYNDLVSESYEAKCALRDQMFSFNIDYLDLYLFPHDRGLFSIKITPTGNSSKQLADFSLLSSMIRLLHVGFEIDNQAHTWESFVDKHILKWIPGAEWKAFTPQLKSYQMINVDAEFSLEEQKNLLYDLGNFAPLESSKGKGALAPSESYFQEQMEQGHISVFRNWSALCLFDSFTRVSSKNPDLFRSWEYDYFNLYVHCLYVKFFMYTTNSKLSDVTQVSKETQHIRDEFIEFINDYHINHVSYKFLPNVLLKKINAALDIEGEVQTMEVKIKRINEHFQETRESQMNLVLTTITFLSIISVIYDISQWSVLMGANQAAVYPYFSTIIALAIVIVIVFIFRRNRRT